MSELYHQEKLQIAENFWFLISSIALSLAILNTSLDARIILTVLCVGGAMASAILSTYRRNPRSIRCALSVVWAMQVYVRLLIVSVFAAFAVGALATYGAKKLVMAFLIAAIAAHLGKSAFRIALLLSK